MLNLIVGVMFPVIGNILWECVMTVASHSHLLTLEIVARSRGGLPSFAKNEEIGLILALLNHIFKSIAQPVRLRM